MQHQPFPERRDTLSETEKAAGARAIWKMVLDDRLDNRASREMTDDENFARVVYADMSLSRSGELRTCANNARKMGDTGFNSPHGKEPFIHWFTRECSGVDRERYLRSGMRETTLASAYSMYKNPIDKGIVRVGQMWYRVWQGDTVHMICYVKQTPPGHVVVSCTGSWDSDSHEIGELEFIRDYSPVPDTPAGRKIVTDYLDESVAKAEESYSQQVKDSFRRLDARKEKRAEYLAILGE
jgi:hypothetical protein